MLYLIGNVYAVLVEVTVDFDQLAITEAGKRDGTTAVHPTQLYHPLQLP